MRSLGFNRASTKGNMQLATACGCLHGHNDRNHNQPLNRMEGCATPPFIAIFRRDALLVRLSAARNRENERKIFLVARISEITQLAGESRSWQVTAAPSSGKRSQHAAWSFRNQQWSPQGGPPRALGRGVTRRSPAVAGMRSTVCI